jgi:hypothetical protein
MAVFFGPVPPGSGPDVFSADESSRLQDAIDDNLAAHLSAWESGQPVGPLEVTVDPTHFDPALGGTNCNDDCEHLGPSSYGVKVANHYYDAAACPSEFPYKTHFVFYTVHGEYIDVECLDGGDNIVIKDDGVIRLDLLRKEPVWRQEYSAHLYLPGVQVPPRSQPAYVKAPGRCPIWSCDPYEVKIQALGGSLPGQEHWGVDLWTGSGGEVRAPWTARVTDVGYTAGLGGYVELDFGDGYTSKLGHLDPQVAPGWTVGAGQLIGYVDDSGYTQDSAHVHFELWRGNCPLDVLEVLNSEEQPPEAVGEE